ncbi:hypothetical protein Phi4:1_gp192 [Cellulophaga phage phi4:1]|uniref:Uncharacterized protein n=5 Tax=Lightbulbvirus TaxID=1918522 RepID=A0A0S2MWV5_9CAUD|nr:hypothetical protein Phi4:1_gp192 [Cellulophaga phage phi4:1]YP_008241688.1 hypothetical protein Phi17:2_gp193 [Cellulophaga phage phi17:2]ALO80201.1 hypothetical protein Phi4113_192 [Cellulophaga phage phi4:1_13]ALO80398.1 hypothetical protein Phi4118_192 [Cellulophaga phage phi4:1_18]ALO80596.1 hypothetical protein Phi17218_193 [Cellulophaga phage phi17:2_18]AGO47726.1 hypothetical protein Phi17:2_gp193 [Cellulophaga phage phi17:2]AGO49605.1 hypothetical protein Phi4:1_gp192 [Cellulophag
MKKVTLLLSMLMILAFTFTPTEVDAQVALPNPDTNRICKTVKVTKYFLMFIPYESYETRCRYQYTY